MEALTFGTLFLGFGGSDIGAEAAGLVPKWGIEFDPDIAGVARNNLPNCRVITGDVRRTDEEIAELGYVDFLLASPPCQAHSAARAKSLPEREDADVGLCILDYARVLRPAAIIIENVPPYRKSPSCLEIIAGLDALGYCVDVQNVNCADFAVPQTRKRMVIRALLGSAVPLLVPTHIDPKKAAKEHTCFLFTQPLPPWIGWYAAIADIVHTLPESQFADWQLKRLPKDILETTYFTNQVGTNGEHGRKTILNKPACLEPAPTVCAHPTTTASYRALLVEGDAAGERPPTCGTSEEPAFAMKTASGGRVHRAVLVDCTHRCEGDLTVRHGAEPSHTICASHTRRPANEPRAFLAMLDNPREAGITCLAEADPCATVQATAMRRPVNEPKAFLAAGGSVGKADMDTLADTPAMTVKSSHEALSVRCTTGSGRVVAMTPRALARFQTIPDWYQLPTKTSKEGVVTVNRTLACKGIGNAVPPLLMERIVKSLLPSLAHINKELKLYTNNKNTQAAQGYQRPHFMPSAPRRSADETPVYAQGRVIAVISGRVMGKVGFDSARHIFRRYNAIG